MYASAIRIKIDVSFHTFTPILHRLVSGSDSVKNTDNFMLLKLDCSLSSRFYAQLPTSSIEGGKLVYAAGWGRTDGHGELIGK